MDRSAGLGHLTASEWERLQDLADRFEQTWHEAEQTGRTVDLAAFLPPPGDPLRPVALHELIKTELEICWRRGQPVEIEFYLHQYPELGAEPPVELLYEEFRVRHVHGDRPVIAGYQQRFPACFDRFQQRVAEQPVQLQATTRYDADPTPAPDAAPHPPAGRSLVIAGDYTLFRRLGTGSYGEVWRALAPGGVEVAVKIITRSLDHEEAQRELQALELTKGLRHPFLLQYQAFWKRDDRLHIVMELAEGSLRDRLQECQKAGQTGIPAAELAGYFREAAEALDFLHSQKVLHRDVKPDNILLLNRHAKVADFGLARQQEAGGLFSASGSGTPAYMAPEVWDRKVCEQSDQYSLAVTYIELRLGRWPFASVMEAMTSTQPNLAPLAKAEQLVLYKAMARAPQHRYASCREFVQALVGALAQQSEAGRSRQRAGRRNFLLALGATLAASGGLLGFLAWRRRDRLPPECVKAAGARLVDDAAGQPYYDRIDRVLKDGTRVPFVLVPQKDAGDPATFYILETKVWNDLFARFAEECPEDVKGSEWRLGAEVQAGGDKPVMTDLLAGNGRLPVFRATVEEAYRCARWLGGNLPTCEQWDRAAGCAEGMRGPYAADVPVEPGQPEVAVDRRRQGPMEVGTAPRDLSPFGCRDMAGNGMEWTRTTIDRRQVPVAEGKELVEVEGRGRSYWRHKEGLRFTNRTDYLRDWTEPLRYALSYPDVGFRVVLEPAPAR